MAAELVASRAVLNSTQLVINLIGHDLFAFEHIFPQFA
jgi:hypothetical protein